MKKYKGFIVLAVVVIVMTIIGYLMKEDRAVYNYGDTYYVVDYFTISIIVSSVLTVLYLIVALVRVLLKRK
jgi:hypothetical protein